MLQDLKLKNKQSRCKIYFQELGNNARLRTERIKTSTRLESKDDQQWALKYSEFSLNRIQ